MQFVFDTNQEKEVKNVKKMFSWNIYCDQNLSSNSQTYYHFNNLLSPLNNIRKVSLLKKAAQTNLYIALLLQKDKKLKFFENLISNPDIKILSFYFTQPSRVQEDLEMKQKESMVFNKNSRINYLNFKNIMIFAFRSLIFNDFLLTFRNRLKVIIYAPMYLTLILKVIVQWFFFSYSQVWHIWISKFIKSR